MNQGEQFWTPSLNSLPCFSTTAASVLAPQNSSKQAEYSDMYRRCSTNSAYSSSYEDVPVFPQKSSKQAEYTDMYGRCSSNSAYSSSYEDVPVFPPKSSKQAEYSDMYGRCSTCSKDLEREPFHFEMTVTSASCRESGSCPRSRQRRGIAASFRNFLMSAHSQGIVKLQLSPPESFKTSIGVLQIIVCDVQEWKKRSAQWFFEDSGSRSPTSFYMRLRRLGFKPLNRAPLSATSGFDFGLERTDVEIHGFKFCFDMWIAYQTSSSSSSCTRKRRIRTQVPCQVGL
jgi:hypothetical protein